MEAAGGKSRSYLQFGWHTAGAAEPHWPHCPPQAPHCGQTHSTVHLRTGVSLVTGWITSRDTSRTRQWPQHPWQPLLQVSPPQHEPEPSQLPHPLQQQLGPGMQTSSQRHVYLCSTTVFGAQYTWQTGTRRQPQLGQHLPQPQHLSQPLQAPQVAAPQVVRAQSPARRSSAHRPLGRRSSGRTFAGRRWPGRRELARRQGRCPAGQVRSIRLDTSS